MRGLALAVQCTVALCLSGCFSSTMSVQRTLVAPMPAMPLTMFDSDHAAQIRFTGDLHPLPLREMTTTSGLGVPFFQGDFGPMIRINERFSAGGVIEFASTHSAQFNRGVGFTQTDDLVLGLRAGVHGTLAEGRVFGLDAAAQVSVHGMPLVIAAPAPLTSGGLPIDKRTVLIPGLSIALLPRFKTPVGTIFVGGTFATNADIQARGLRINNGNGTVTDDFGGIGTYPVAMVGAGYSVTLPMGLGFHIQGWLPVTQGPIGYNAMFAASLSYAWGVGPTSRGERDDDRPRAPLKPPTMFKREPSVPAAVPEQPAPPPQL